MVKLTVFWISIMYGGVRGTPMNAISVSIAKIFTLEKSIIFRFFKALNMFFVSFFPGTECVIIVIVITVVIVVAAWSLLLSLLLSFPEIS